MTKDEMEIRARALLDEVHHIRMTIIRAEAVALAKENEARQLISQVCELPQQEPWGPPSC